jgi:hypothetical protein
MFLAPEVERNVTRSQKWLKLKDPDKFAHYTHTKSGEIGD